MSEIRPVSTPSATSLNPTAGGVNRSAQVVEAAAAKSDRVELSVAAKLLNRIMEMPEIRQELVDRVRAEIAAGGYESDDKVETTLDRALEDLS